ncbi:putative voltage-dependent anion channel [Rosa chinensis]|uniref:Putative voltage-dependent anion channel n=1 Tax=Rosa chinensis TaxID=74649 RepID=A0A2P6P7L5_ROSCH|nr:guard cell S-type anion channel SLAC1 [Rosa chinensis]PRQ17935.1 putative voltage-dependent anion channel [Rosa chinensis]
MDKRKTSPCFLDTHLIDIHDVLPEEEEQEEGITEEENGKAEKRLNKPIKVREMKSSSQRRSINRQVSLETGFSVLRKESKSDKDEIIGVNLPRSGRSLGGFDSINRFGMEGRKGDFSIFKTKSSNPSRQNSLLPSKKERSEMESQKTDGAGLDESVDTSVPAGRYFAALRGPELDQVKDDEDILLPKDEQWPFLLRFPIGCFGICLGLSSQAVLWHALATSPATEFLHIPLFINLALWLLALAVLFCVSFTYILKILFYFEAVKREYFHPVRVNFFFAPWVVCMFLALGAPPTLFPNKLQPAIWCTFMLPYFLLELKIYGQWLSGGKRRLCKVANPSSHLSVVGNFVGAILAAKVGWKEPAKFLWAVGFAHYFVVFVTLYQRLPTSEALPRELHPVYSMFIAAPSAASMAWQDIYGDFNEVSRTCYFIALFLYISLVVRIKFFTGFRFSVAWWAYTFPMTTFSVATIKYAEEVPSVLTKGLAVTLSFMSSTTVSVLFVSTLLHAFVWHTLFPNDLAIAITKRRLGKFKKAYDIKRWTKQALTKNNIAAKVGGKEESLYP